MKMKLMVIIMIAACFISGCTLLEQFEQAKDEYLDNRVNELLAEIPEDETVVEEPLVEDAVEEAEEVIPEESHEDEEGSESEEESHVDEDGTEEEHAVEELSEEEEETPEPVDEIEEETPEPEPTVESSDPADYLGDAIWTDEMDTAEYWPTGTDQYSSASFENGKLLITALSETNGWRIASTPVLENAYIQADVEMGTCADTDGYGFIFRVPENTGYNQGYLFGITCDGRYSLRKWNGLTGENGSMMTLKYFTVSESINKGKDQSNRIGVMTLNDRLVMFVNGEKVYEASDDAFTSGFFGLYVNRDKTENLSVLVDSVSYWTDPVEN